MKAGVIPEPFSYPEAALKILRGHYEVMEHAARFIELSNDQNAASEIMTEGNLTKILDLLPKRLRMTESDLVAAEMDVKKRTVQYMCIKEWVTKTQRTLILQGTKLEEKAETLVTMITTDNHSSGGVQNSNRITNQGGKSNNKRWQDKRNGKQQGHSNGKTITECGYCNLIREKDVSQEYVQRDFKDMH